MIWASLVTQTIKNPQCRRSRFDPWVGKISWRREWQPTPVFLSGESAWIQEPGGLQSMGSQRVGHDWASKHKRSTGKARWSPVALNWQRTRGFKHLNNFRLQNARWTALASFPSAPELPALWGDNAYSRLLQMKDLILCLLFFPPSPIIRKSCFSFRIRQLFFC